MLVQQSIYKKFEGDGSKVKQPKQEILKIECKKEQKTQKSDQDSQNSSIHYSMHEVVKLQNQNRKYKQALNEKQEQVIKLSQKSFEIGKTYMQVLKQKDQLLSKYKEGQQKYISTKNKMVVSNFEKSSLIESLKWEQSQMKHKIVESQKKISQAIEILRNSQSITEEQKAYIVKYLEEAKNDLK